MFQAQLDKCHIKESGSMEKRVARLQKKKNKVLFIMKYCFFFLGSIAFRLFLDAGGIP
jgi:hypothetical protein